MTAALVPYLRERPASFLVHRRKGSRKSVIPFFAIRAEFLPTNSGRSLVYVVPEAEVEYVGTVNHGTVSPGFVVCRLQRPVN
jgi:hypothetical protein